ncbi:MAG: hypothetical protein ACLP01_20070 [Solirubrobacteraceae bacterium]
MLTQLDYARLQVSAGGGQTFGVEARGSEMLPSADVAAALHVEHSRVSVPKQRSANSAAPVARADQTWVSTCGSVVTKALNDCQPPDEPTALPPVPRRDLDLGNLQGARFAPGQTTIADDGAVLLTS